MHVVLQCPSGVSGDMLLGALVDAGADLAVVTAAVDAVSPEPVQLQTERVRRAGFSALQVHVRVEESHHHRRWSDVRRLLEVASLAEPVRARSLRVFEALAAAEGRVHGVAADEVHFHEVGALDSIADVVGVCAALEDLSVTDVHAETVAVGGGTVITSHGTLPVPVPAVVALLEGTGAVLVSGPSSRELCTPTGAAILAAEVSRWGPPPPARVVGSGVGAGGADLPEQPNVVRAVLLDPVAQVTVPSVSTTSTLVLSTNVDDLEPRLWPEVIQAVLRAGADDAWLTPITMKKGRPAQQLSALCARAALTAVRDTILRETTSLGVRVTAAEKHAVPRTERVVEVRGHAVRVKLGWLDGGLVNQQPEHDEVVALARAAGVPTRVALGWVRDALGEAL